MIQVLQTRRMILQQYNNKCTMSLWFHVRFYYSTLNIIMWSLQAKKYILLLEIEFYFNIGYKLFVFLVYFHFWIEILHNRCTYIIWIKTRQALSEIFPSFKIILDLDSKVKLLKWKWMLMRKVERSNLWVNVKALFVLWTQMSKKRFFELFK